MRIFFAVVPGSKTLERLADVMDVLRRRAKSEDIRWVGPEQLHFTLKFLGEQPEERVSDAISAARKAAVLCSPFEIALGGLGGFPTVMRPRVVWVGTASGAEPFIELAARLDRELSKVEFAPESRPFVPHLTLARTKSREGEQAAAQAIEQAGEVGDFEPERVDRFVLMQSQLSRTGASYSVVEEFVLERSW